MIPIWMLGSAVSLQNSALYKYHQFIDFSKFHIFNFQSFSIVHAENVHKDASWASIYDLVADLPDDHEVMLVTLPWEL